MTNLNQKITILGKGNKNSSTIPTSVRVWTSKFDKDINDKVKFEGEEWRVISVGFTSEAEAKSCMDGMVRIFKQKGYWNGSTKVAHKF